MRKNVVARNMVSFNGNRTYSHFVKVNSCRKIQKKYRKYDSNKPDVQNSYALDRGKSERASVFHRSSDSFH